MLDLEHSRKIFFSFSIRVDKVVKRKLCEPRQYMRETLGDINIIKEMRTR